MASCLAINLRASYRDECRNQCFWKARKPSSWGDGFLQNLVSGTVMRQQIQEVVNQDDEVLFVPSVDLAEHEVTLFHVEYLHIFRGGIQLVSQVVDMLVQELMFIAVAAVVHLGRLTQYSGKRLAMSIGRSPLKMEFRL